MPLQYRAWVAATGAGQLLCACGFWLHDGPKAVVACLSASDWLAGTDAVQANVAENRRGLPEGA